MPPLVSVICLSYNHAPFIQEAIESVLNQTYTPIEIIVVDDGSSDGSAAVIEGMTKRHPQIDFIKLENNVGNCAAFNIGFSHSKGEYIIDFATDDILLPTRIEEGILAMEKMGPEYGVQFSDADLINSAGESLGHHSNKHPHHIIAKDNIYIDVIRKYFICAPTMLIRREVLNRLGGYDESLAYEDFDFWIRSSRIFKYFYLPDVLVKRRMVTNSMGSRQFRRGSPQLQSTFKVCRKILELNQSVEENQALGDRIRYEILVCIRLLELKLAFQYVKLWLSIK